MHAIRIARPYSYCTALGPSNTNCVHHHALVTKRQENVQGARRVNADGDGWRVRTVIAPQATLISGCDGLMCSASTRCTKVRAHARARASRLPASPARAWSVAAASVWLLPVCGCCCACVWLLHRRAPGVWLLPVCGCCQCVAAASVAAAMPVRRACARLECVC